MNNANNDEQNQMNNDNNDEQNQMDDDNNENDENPASMNDTHYHSAASSSVDSIESIEVPRGPVTGRISMIPFMERNNNNVQA